MKKQYYLILYSIFLSFYLMGQHSKVFPGHSLSLLNVVIDSTTINSFLDSSPYKYTSGEYYDWNTFYLLDSTIILSTHKFDKNRIIRRIEYNPKEVDTLNTDLIIGETKLRDYLPAKDRSYFPKSDEYIYLREEGITYYFKLNIEEEQNSTLSKIIVKSESISVSNTPNYQFNYSLISEDINKVFAMISVPEIDDKLISEWPIIIEGFSKEITVFDKINREITTSLDQLYAEVRIVKARFSVNVIYDKNTKEIQYSYFGNRDTTLYEYFNDSNIYNFGASNRRTISLEDYRETNIKETVGFWCGAGGSPPKRCYLMIEAINNRDDATLYEWLSSINPEISAYGYIGMKFLEMEKYRSKLSYQDLMRERESNQTSIFSCMGCSFSNHWVFFDYIIFNDLRNNWKSFKKTRFIR